MRVKRCLGIALLVASAWANLAQADAASDFGVQLPHTSKPAPNFTLPNMEAGQVSLKSLRGSVVLLHFWATWCVACRHEMPHIDQLWQHYRSQGVTLLGINVDRGSGDAVHAYLNRLGVGFPSLLDPEGKVRNQYAVRALPTTYAIDRQGNIIGRIIGERDWSSQQARQWITTILQHP